MREFTLVRTRTNFASLVFHLSLCSNAANPGSLFLPQSRLASHTQEELSL